MVDKQRYSDRVVQALRSAVADGEAGLRDVPELIIKVIEEQLWRERHVQSTGKIMRFDSFEEFVESSPPEGLGTDVATLLKLCEKKPRVLDLIERVTQRARGGDRRSASFTDKNGGNKSNFKVDNIKFENSPKEPGKAASEVVSQTAETSKTDGNSRPYALRRLRKSHPELHEKVLTEEISAHQAMITAGYRRKTVSVPVEPKAAARVLAGQFGPVEFRLLLKELISIARCRKHHSDTQNSES